MYRNFPSAKRSIRSTLLVKESEIPSQLLAQKISYNYVLSVCAGLNPHHDYPPANYNYFF